MTYELQQYHGFDMEYAAVLAGTRHWTTPHLHIYCWIDDPDNEVRATDFRPAIEAFVEGNPRASRAGHPIHEHGDTGAVTVEHDPPLVDEPPDSF